jgi:adenylate kinase family enzyme
MRVAIIGNSGSGKTTLAERLAGDAQAAMLDLDTVAWEPDQIAVARPIEAALADVREFCESHESWVVEGCYAGLVEAALEFTPHLLVLDPGLAQCVDNCRSRPWEPNKYSSMEEQDEKLAFLLTWVEEYYSREGDMSLAAHEAVFERYDGPKEWLSALPAADFTLRLAPTDST